MPRFRKDPAAESRWSFCQIGLQAVEMFFINNLGVDFSEIFIIPAQLRELFLQKFQESFFNRLFANNVVGSDTGLPCIDQFAESYPAGSQFQISVCSHNCG